MNRTIPVDADPQMWAAFIEWADNNDIGTHPDDWGIWWDCFSAGVNAMMERL